MQLGKWIQGWFHQIFTPSQWMRLKYQAFRQLLHHDQLSHQAIAELESVLYDEKRVDFAAVVDHYARIAKAVEGIITAFGEMSPRSPDSLRDRFHTIDASIRSKLLTTRADSSPPYVFALEEVPPDSERLVGGKAAHLAEIVRDLHLPAPWGFAITVNAFHALIEHNQLRPEIDLHLARLDASTPASLEQAATHLTRLITNAVLPPELETAIQRAYRRLTTARGAPCRVAVRSSAIGEDAQSSFAGQYRSLLEVAEAGLGNAYKQVVASKYAPRALYYRIEHGLLDTATPMAVLVLSMIEARSSGVVYSRNPVQPGSDSIMIYSTWGLGEALVGGRVAPDTWELTRDESPQVVRRELATRGPQAAPAAANRSTTGPLAVAETQRFSLDDATAQQLARWALQLEAHFHCPQDMEWCQRPDGQPMVLQARPLQLESTKIETAVCRLDFLDTPVRLEGGIKAASGVGTGKVFKALRPGDLENVPPGSVLVAPTTSPDFVKIIDRLRAVVTDVGSSAGHFASIAREFRVPTLVNTREATRTLQDGEIVTVFADAGKVFAGALDSALGAPCLPREPGTNNPMRVRVKSILESISPLNLVDPQSPAFVPERCQTLHDIVRFAHEKAVQEMFFFGKGGGRKLQGAKKLLSPIPILLYVLDLGQGLREEAATLPVVRSDQVCNPPFLAIWKGLSHPDIVWSPDIKHFDWEAMDRMSAGIVSLESPLLASYALMSRDYLNLSVHFGYHFVVVDTLCGAVASENYIFLHFKGGGAAPENRLQRVKFLELVLREYGFAITTRGDLLDAQLRGATAEIVEDKLEIIGRLLGSTRVLDMILKNDATTLAFVSEFLQGNYRLSPINSGQARVPGL